MRRTAALVIAMLCVAAGCGGAGPEPADAGPVLPPGGAIADYQLGGAYEPAADVEIVTRDRTDEPAEGRYSICYVNAFQTQPDAGDWWVRHHPDLLLRDTSGRPVEDEGWPGEYLFDISTGQNRDALAQIVGGWFAQCAGDGFDAVEPDNLDSFTRSRGLLSEQDAVAFARLLVAKAHGTGLTIAQKNTVEIDGAALGFDFAVAEECAVHDECAEYVAMYGRRVIEIEYTDHGRQAYAAACREAAGQRSILLRDRDVVPSGHRDYVFEHC